MRGRVLPIKVYASSLSALSPGPWNVHASDPSPFIACGVEFHLSRFTYQILRLCHFICQGSRLQTTSFLPSVSPTGDSFIYGPVLPTFNHAADFILLAFSILRGGELSKAVHLVLRLYYLDLILQTSSFLPSVSYAGWSPMHPPGLHIRFSGHLAVLILFCPQHLTRKTSFINSVFPKFSYEVLGVLPSLFKVLDAISNGQ